MQAFGQFRMVQLLSIGSFVAPLPICKFPAAGNITRHAGPCIPVRSLMRLLSESNERYIKTVHLSTHVCQRACRNGEADLLPLKKKRLCTKFRNLRSLKRWQPNAFRPGWTAKFYQSKGCYAGRCCLSVMVLTRIQAFVIHTLLTHQNKPLPPH